VDNLKLSAQILWGIALVIMGVAVFFRTPFVMARVSQIGQYTSSLLFVRLSLYLMAFLLIGGGIKKLVPILKQKLKNRSNQ